MITEYGSDVPGLAIVRSARGWARTLHRYVVDHGGAVVRTRPLEERQAVEDEYDVLVVDDISSFLSARIVEEIHRRGRRVLGVFDPDEFSPSGEAEAGRTRLERLGVDAIIDAAASPEEFVRIIREMVPVRSPQATPDFLPDSFGEDQDVAPGTALDLPDPYFGDQASGMLLPPPMAVGERRKGHITAVFGASGGSGVTEVAIELARTLGRRGERAVVVDGDEMAPSMAQRLNLALHPNLRTAVDVVEHGTGRLPDCLTGIATGLEVLVGLPHPRDWVELRGTDLAAVVNELARGRNQIVVNGSPFIEDLSAFGSADRFGMSRAVISSADSIVVVCPPTPMGVARLIDRVAELADLAEGKPIHVVVNRTQKGSFKRKEIAREIQRSFNPSSIHFLPADPRVEAASWEGTLVPAGDFTKALASTLTPVIPEALAPGQRKGTKAAKAAKLGAAAPAQGAHARKGA